eukprot:scaffold93485_cov48-Phaeocystis_antarctica.AAC.1
MNPSPTRNSRKSWQTCDGGRRGLAVGIGESWHRERAYLALHAEDALARGGAQVDDAVVEADALADACEALGLHLRLGARGVLHLQRQPRHGHAHRVDALDAELDGRLGAAVDGRGRHGDGGLHVDDALGGQPGREGAQVLALHDELHGAQPLPQHEEAELGRLLPRVGEARAQPDRGARGRGGEVAHGGPRPAGHALRDDAQRAEGVIHEVEDREARHLGPRQLLLLRGLALLPLALLLLLLL